VDGISPRRITFALTALAGVLLIGTIGFRWSLDESWLQSFYRSVVTSALLGLDTIPKNDSSRILSIFMVLAGVTIFAFVASTVVEGIAQGVLTGGLAEKRRRRAIDRLRDHYIICGYGRVGHKVGADFREAGVAYVVLDTDPHTVEEARKSGELCVEGSGTVDSDLQAAGLFTARGLVISTDSDVDNLYVALTARAERPDLLIVARASTEKAAEKLHRAGADRVILPYTTAGQEMAKLVLRPQVAAFLDVVTSAAGPDLRLEEIEVTASCGQVGKTIRELRVRRDTGALIIAIRGRDGSFETTPSPDSAIEVGDVLITVGTQDELRGLEEMFRPQEAVAG
jgi:voltage-gated potassium channel